jgi:phosphoribosylformylglycinamidine synthase subunit PurS
MATSESRHESYVARVRITLKPVVLDPQGDTVLAALHQLDFPLVTSVRVGKYLEIALQAENVEDASSLVRRMCDQLLANPVIERYDFTVEAGEPGPP